MRKIVLMSMFLFFTLFLPSANALDLPLYTLPVTINGITYQHGAMQVDNNGSGWVWYYNQTPGQQLYMCYCQCPLPLNPTVYIPYNRWDIFFTEATFCYFDFSTTDCTWHTASNSNMGMGTCAFINGDGGQAYSDMDWVNTDSGLCYQGTLFKSANWNFSSPNEDDHFTWPVDPHNISNGHYGWCADWDKHPGGCYWLDDFAEDTEAVWRDAQPFLMHKYKGKYHLGADYNLGTGDSDLDEPVYPSAHGTILDVKENECGWRNILFVKHETSFGVYTSMYAHVNWLESGKPEIGAEVYPDIPIAYIGKGDWSNNLCCKNPKKCQYDAHLHFEIREGENITPGPAYTRDKSTPQGQVDPNIFISIHRQ